MNTFDFLCLAGFVTVLLVVIIASYTVKRTLWRYCYRCRFYHNEIGERHPNVPLRGRIGTDCLCEKCKVEVRGV